MNFRLFFTFISVFFLCQSEINSQPYNPHCIEPGYVCDSFSFDQMSSMSPQERVNYFSSPQPITDNLIHNPYLEYWTAKYQSLMDGGSYRTKNITFLKFYKDTDNDGFADNPNDYVFFMEGEVFTMTMTSNGLHLPYLHHIESPYEIQNQQHDYNIIDNGTIANQISKNRVFIYNGHHYVRRMFGFDCDPNNPNIPMGIERIYADKDGDGYGDYENLAMYEVEVSDGLFRTFYPLHENYKVVNCPYESVYDIAYSYNNLDCNDYEETITTESVNWYVDNDGDGFGDPNTFVVSCQRPLDLSTAYVLNNEDCNDNDIRYNNASLIWYADFDNDGFGDPNNQIVASCPPGDNYVRNCYFDDCPNEAGKRGNGCPITSYDFDNNQQNYDYQRIYLEPFTAEAVNNTMISSHDVREQITYSDAIGRVKQINHKNQTPNGHDIIMHYEYDANGDQTKTYLPYTKQSNGFFDSNALNNTLNHYNSETYNLTTNPYSEERTEDSPLRRTLEIGAPGADWEIDPNTNNDHTIKYSYTTNNTAPIKKFSVLHLNAFIENTKLTYDGNYNVNALTKLIVKNENWQPNQAYPNNNTTETFTDIHGHTILNRAYNDGIPHDTYYVYDSFGNLTYVLPPEASDDILIESNMGFSIAPVNFPWTRLVNVDRDFADQYERRLADYANEDILNADLENAYGGQGGFTISAVTSGAFTLSINMALNQGVALKTGELLALDAYGKFKDAELGVTSDGNYLFYIRNNAIWIDYIGSSKTSPAITFMNYSFSNTTKLSYNQNHAWPELLNIDPKEAAEYMSALKDINNDAILETEIPNSYGAQGGINLSIDDNDIMTLTVNMSSHTPIRLKTGILFALNTKRRFPDKTIGQIGAYKFSIQDNSIYVETEAPFTNLAGTLYTSSEAPNFEANTLSIEGLCYIYHYDYKHRLIEKKIPGKGWEYIVYDPQDRPVLVQDAKLRENQQWLFNKYDHLGRTVYNGIHQFTPQGSEANAGRLELQSIINTQTNFEEVRLNAATTLDDTAIYYSNTAYPNTNITLLNINYYDDYDVGLHTDFAYQDSYGQTLLHTTKDLPTISKVRVLDEDDWTTSVTYYDDTVRPIYLVSQNSYLNTLQWVKTKYNFASEVLETKGYHLKNGHTAIETVNRFTYDHAGRLLTQTQTINNGAPELIVNNHYDALGRLLSKDVGGEAASNPTYSPGLQTVDYSYNIRGWLTGINDSDNLGSDLFGFKLNYNTTSLSDSNALYNGNISETHWSTSNDHIERHYNYSYDALNRITGAMYSNSGDQLGGMLAQEDYSISKIRYDLNGNITNLQRMGRYYQTPQYSGMERYDVIDKLSYSYAPLSNKLVHVDDDASHAFGFKDVATPEDYTYDSNGNMTSDANKGILAIVYNHLNLPTKITTAQGGIEYVYDASGSKLQKVVSQGSTVMTTNYAGGYIYQHTQSNSETLQFFNQPEGYVKPNGTHFEYVYQYKDHLGNVRLSYQDINNNGAVDSSEILEENHYYPFGLQHKGYNNVVNANANDTASKFKFNNAEIEDALGLNLYEMTWRQYDPSIARWTGIDPITHHSMSTYTAFDNNPVFWADPSGADSENYFEDPPDRDGIRPEEIYYDEDGRAYSWDDELGVWLDHSALEEVLVKVEKSNPFEELDLEANLDQNIINEEEHPLDRAFYKGYWLAQLWRKFGYFEAGVSVVKGAPFEIKLNKAYAIEIATDKETYWSSSWNNREGGTTTSGYENHDKEFNVGFGAVGGGNISIIDKPDGNVDYGFGLAYSAVTYEYFRSVEPNSNGSQNSHFFGLDLSPGIALWFGVEANLRLGFLID